MFTNYRRLRLIQEYQMMSLPLSNQAGSFWERLYWSLRRKRLFILMPARKIAGKIMLKRKEKRKINCSTGSANFFWIAAALNLLFSGSSSLRLVNAFTKMFSTAGGCIRLNMVKPKNGFATNSNTARLKIILAEVSLCI